jgi:hypothetical protein
MNREEKVKEYQERTALARTASMEFNQLYAGKTCQFSSVTSSGDAIYVWFENQQDLDNYPLKEFNGFRIEKVLNRKICLNLIPMKLNEIH